MKTCNNTSLSCLSLVSPTRYKLSWQLLEARDIELDIDQEVSYVIWHPMIYDYPALRRLLPPTTHYHSSLPSHTPDITHLKRDLLVLLSFQSPEASTAASGPECHGGKQRP